MFGVLINLDDDGYYPSSTSCLPFEGSCNNGNLITQSSRTVANHCGTCVTGYHISGTSCQVNVCTCTTGGTCKPN